MAAKEANVSPIHCALALTLWASAAATDAVLVAVAVAVAADRAAVASTPYAPTLAVLNKSRASLMRLLHTMLRVGNLQRSIDFYTQVLGMQLLRTSDNPEHQYSLAFLGFEGGNPGQAEIELTHNWGVTHYDHGTAYGHIALGVPDASAACVAIKAAGGLVAREAGPVKGGTTVIAFVTDPDGYKIELIQRTFDDAGVGLR